LRVRDILVWNSEGTMVNAAVMGIVPAIRFVLLSDALLRLMSPEQIEAVFGHEAGHVRHRHIQHFLMFALVGWLIAAGWLELFATFGTWLEAGAIPAVLVVEAAGLAVAVGLWALGFIWLSRQFERQADLFGAWCVTPSSEGCRRPCSLHGGSSLESNSDRRICATAAAIFASALHRVAHLNGIPLEERSWRHSSIESRVRFLHRLAGDPQAARRFHRTLRVWKQVMVAAAFAGSVVSVFYLFPLS
jgi:STE24 endopeptidase